MDVFVIPKIFQKLECLARLFMGYFIEEPLNKIARSCIIAVCMYQKFIHTIL